MPSGNSDPAMTRTVVPGITGVGGRRSTWISTAPERPAILVDAESRAYPSMTAVVTTGTS